MKIKYKDLICNWCKSYSYKQYRHFLVAKKDRVPLGYQIILPWTYSFSSSDFLLPFEVNKSNPEIEKKKRNYSRGQTCFQVYLYASFLGIFQCPFFDILSSKISVCLRSPQRCLDNCFEHNFWSWGSCNFVFDIYRYRRFFWRVFQ